ncbi:hypothetical protein EH221_04385 [bacterium]|nr:MAG: hypothetical protein EH221_04385 [bacterium]
MPQLSLTDFVDIVSTSGIPKATKVRQIKNRLEYRPEFDFYKIIREQIIDIHKHRQPKNALENLTDKLKDPKKKRIYKDIVNGYIRWWGRKTLLWFTPPTLEFSNHGVTVTVNPELGLKINGMPHLIKLYFKSDKLVKNKIDIITHLMEICLQDNSTSIKMSVLDTRRSKLVTPTVPIENLDAVLDAELAYIAELWKNL